MPFKLDIIDTAIINSLLEDGRKSFRQISREINVSTPTVNNGFQKLTIMGLNRFSISVQYPDKIA